MIIGRLVDFNFYLLEDKLSLPDLFKDLKLDSWYKAFVYIGGAVLIISFFIEVKGITNTQLQLLSGGTFLIGIGEWKNHKVVSTIKPPNAYTGPAAYLEYTIRKPDFLGALFDILGIILILVFVWNIVK
jgi:hypothetical protein